MKGIDFRTIIRKHYFETSDEEFKDFQDYRPDAWQRGKQVYKTNLFKYSLEECRAPLIV